MAYTFLKSQGKPVGKSLVENDKLDLARGLLEDAKAKTSNCCCPSITLSHGIHPIPLTKITDIASHAR